MTYTLKEVARKAVVVEADTPVSDAVVKMMKEGSDLILISREGEIAGIVTEQDVVKKVVAKKLNPETVRVDQVMKSPVPTVESNMDLRAARRLMAEKKLRHLPVLEKGKIIGIVTEKELIEDVRSHFSTAYVLVKADPGKDEEIYSLIRKLEEVRETALTYGAYDLIAKVEFGNFLELDNFIFKKVRTISGIRETVTILTSRT